MTHYTCMFCHKQYGADDPGFIRRFAPTTGLWQGQSHDGHCADEVECRRRRKNRVTGVAPEQLELVAI